MALSEGAKLRKQRIREGKCTACGKRKAMAGVRECGPCRAYFRAWAQKRAAILARKGGSKSKPKAKPATKKPARARRPAAQPQLTAVA